MKKTDNVFICLDFLYDAGIYLTRLMVISSIYNPFTIWNKCYINLTLMQLSLSLSFSSH